MMKNSRKGETSIVIKQVFDDPLFTHVTVADVLSLTNWKANSYSATALERPNSQGAPRCSLARATRSQISAVGDARYAVRPWPS